MSGSRTVSGSWSSQTPESEAVTLPSFPGLMKFLSSGGYVADDHAMFVAGWRGLAENSPDQFASDALAIESEQVVSGHQSCL